MKSWIGIVVLVVIVAGAMMWRSWSDKAVVISVKVPQLSAAAKAGEQAFIKNCASCHGLNAAGSKRGPSLIYQIYQPGPHGDAAFLSAMRIGVRRHHWQFGNMPKQTGISEQEEKDIITYVREVQRANGIE